MKNEILKVLKAHLKTGLEISSLYQDEEDLDFQTIDFQIDDLILMIEKMIE